MVDKTMVSLISADHHDNILHGRIRLHTYVRVQWQSEVKVGCDKIMYDPGDVRQVTGDSVHTLRFQYLMATSGAGFVCQWLIGPFSMSCYTRNTIVHFKLNNTQPKMHTAQS